MLFCPADPALKAIKLHTHNLNVAYNITREDETERRAAILAEILGSFGEGGFIQGPIAFHYGKHTHIGAHFFGNFNLTIEDDAEVTIGDHCDFGPNVTIVTPLHPMVASERLAMRTASGEIRRMVYAKPVHIGNNCWFGASVTVCPGVTIGDNCVIGAGSVVHAQHSCKQLCGRRALPRDPHHHGTRQHGSQAGCSGRERAAARRGG